MGATVHAAVFTTVPTEVTMVAPVLFVMVELTVLEHVMSVMTVVTMFRVLHVAHVFLWGWCRATTQNWCQKTSIMAFAFFIDHLEVFVSVKVMFQKYVLLTIISCTLLATEFHMFVTTFFTLSALDLATAITASFRGTTVFEQSLDDIVHFFSFGGMELNGDQNNEV